MRTLGKPTLFSEVWIVPGTASNPLGVKAAPHHGGGSSHHFPVIAGVPQGKKGPQFPSLVRPRAPHLSRQAGAPGRKQALPEVLSQDRESLTLAPRYGGPAASQRWRDLVSHQPLLIRRVVLHEAESRAVPSAPPRPSQVLQPRQVQVPVTCQAEGKPLRQGKCQGGKIGSRLPAIISLEMPSAVPVKLVTFKGCKIRSP